MIKQLVYVSQASRNLLDSQNSIKFELNTICTKARELNGSIAVTGILLYKSGHFLQVLEGSGIVLKRLYEKISKDPRHCEVEQLAMIESEHRLFENWNMGLVNLDDFAELDLSIFDDTIRTLRCAGRTDEKLTRERILQSLRIFIDNEAAATSVG